MECFRTDVKVTRTKLDNIFQRHGYIRDQRVQQVSVSEKQRTSAKWDVKREAKRLANLTVDSHI